MLIKLLVAAGLVTSGGCSCVTDDQAGCDALAEAVTAYVQKCFPTNTIASAVTKRFAGQCQRVAGARGVTGFGATLAACTAAYESATETCAAIDTARCLPPTGAEPNGARCGADAQCASGLCLSLIHI